ncbi:SRC2-like protein [Tanacetum coccineum]
MEYRTFELSIISAEGLKKPSSANKSDQVYAIAYIAGKLDRFQTPVDKKGGLEPTWSHQPMTFTINEAEALRNSLMLVIKLKAVRMFFDKNLGEVRVPIKQLIEGIRDEGKEIQVVSYYLQRKSNEPGGFLRFLYKFGRKFLTLVYRSAGTRSAYGSSSGVGTGFVPGMVVGSSVATHHSYHGGGGGCGGGGCGGGGGGC